MMTESAQRSAHFEQYLSLIRHIGEKLVPATEGRAAPTSAALTSKKRALYEQWRSTMRDLEGVTSEDPAHKIIADEAARVLSLYNGACDQN